ncbi:MAG: transcription antitermination factor NusB [Treponema sp.]|nr:transcription antitermination factor NusB [Treponema sp.]
MASRRKARILAFQTLYAWDISGARSTNVPEDTLSSGFTTETGETLAWEALPDFTRLLISGTLENIGAIDAMIREHLENWDFSRLNRVDLAIMRISAYALMYQTETAPSIIINEAISISKEYGTDDSYRFINGVLDAINKSLEKPGTDNKTKQ